MNLLTLHFIRNHTVYWLHGSQGCFKCRLPLLQISCLAKTCQVGVMKKWNSEWGILTWDSLHCGVRFSIKILLSEQTCSELSEKSWLWGVLHLENSAKYISHFQYLILWDAMNSRTRLQFLWLLDINGTIATQFKFCFNGRKFVISFCLKLEEIEGDDKNFRWALNVVTILKSLLFWLYSEILFRKNWFGNSCPGKKYLPHFLDPCTFSCHANWCF